MGLDGRAILIQGSAALRDCGLEIGQACTRISHVTALPGDQKRRFWQKNQQGSGREGILTWNTNGSNARGRSLRLQLNALAYNLANLLRTLALPNEVERWSLTSLREKVVKIGAKVLAHARYCVFQMAEAAVPRDLLHHILEMIGDLRPRPVVRC